MSGSRSGRKYPDPTEFVSATLGLVNVHGFSTCNKNGTVQRKTKQILPSSEVQCAAETAQNTGTVFAVLIFCFRTLCSLEAVGIPM